jgi:predicted RNA binding protein YcfA (HicA-like mRNA interferase family)
MSSLPSLKAKQVVRALQRAGFYIHHQTGSHARMIHAENPARRVTIPIHGKDIPRGTLANIIRQSGLTIDEFLEKI